MNFTVTLGNSQGEELQLSYSLNSSASALVWWNCLQQAAQKSQIENSVFFNFAQNQTKALCDKLEETLLSLQKSIPALSSAKLNRADLQNSLNRLHTNFAHSHLIENSITEEIKPLWSAFNMLIHQVESALVAKTINSTLDLSRIEFFWKDNFRTPIPEECYHEYSLLRNFGSVQINYCQVGRQLTELYAAQDSAVPVEHIQPARFFSANSTLWFGPDIPESYQVEQTEKIRLWHLLQKSKFESAGVNWDRADKALGAVTVAQLIRKFSTLEEKKLFQRELAGFDRVLSVNC